MATEQDLPEGDFDILELILEQRGYSQPVPPDEEFQVLRAVHSLRAVFMVMPGLSDEAYAFLAGNPELTRLNIESGGHLTDGVLAHLSGLKQLEELSIHSASRLIGRGFRGAAWLPSIRKLSFMAGGLNDEAVRLLATCPRLEHLRVTGERLTVTSLQALASSPSLASLVLGGTPKITDADLAATLPALTRLRKLHLERIDFGPGAAAATATPNASLQVVTVNNYPTPGLSLAGSVPELMLSLQNTSANGRNWALLSSGTGSGLAGALRFFDSTAGVDRMVINSAGNVGIGTFAPRGKLDVNGDAYVNGNLLVKETAAIFGLGRLHIQSATSNGLGGIFLNPFAGGGDVYVGGAANLFVGGEVSCVAVNITSDRNAKEQFKPVSAREVLAKVAALPITEWQYKTQGDARHIGPMAQDFHAAFGTGRDDKHITSVDADGVALAAIQGLHEIVKEKSAEVDALKQSVAELRAMVQRLAQPAGR